jgi:large subunit ribosomal protein L6
MKRDLTKTIEIPPGVKVEIDKNIVSVKGAQGELKRKFKFKQIKFEVKDNKVIISCKNSSKNEKRVMNTSTAHITNMIKGAAEKFEYQLKVCASHFPMTVEVKGNTALIKNFLGEKIPRKVKIIKGVDVDVQKEIITVKSADKELAGQTAANFEKATFISLRDRRVFQDGVFITKKAGREM